ncbi:Arc family DNA-binding protein, partial [Metapseudomonas otitidis]|uniref:Arc family DNA-binding protein n=1 Tax=Metapseudomonas otitidis TaxID=319939 RepID=UPI002810F9AD
MSRADAEFALRLPELLRARIERAASASRRSLNAEVVVRLEHSFCREGVADGDAPLPAQTAPRGLRLLCLLVPETATQQHLYILAELYLLSAVLKRWEDEGRK